MSDDNSEQQFGHADGDVIEDYDGVKERIVYDYDEDGTVIGWHKEAIDG